MSKRTSSPMSDRCEPEDMLMSAEPPTIPIEGGGNVNVRELIEQLSQWDPETPVVMASDPEGNSFHPVGDTEADSAIDYGVGTENESCIVLWP